MEAGNKCDRKTTSAGNHNKLTTEGAFNYEFDDEGNLVKRTKISDGKVTEYVYDHRNRLTLVNQRDASGGPLVAQGEGGRRWLERIWTTMATCAQQGHSAFEFLFEAVCQYFQGGPAPSLLPNTS